VLIGDWAAAAAQVLGSGTITTPTGLLTAREAWRRSDKTARGRTDRPGWRRAVPEPAVTAWKDARTWRRAASRVTTSELDRVSRLGIRTPFVWQYHWMFERRGIAIADRLGVPLVVAVDAPLVWEAARWGVRRPGWGRLLERAGELRTLGQAALVTTISDEVRDQLVARGVPRDRILVTPNTADPSRFTHADRERFRAIWQTGDRTVIGWIGSFRGFHALDVLLQAFERVASRRSDCLLVLVGDGPERRACEQLADRIGRDRVILAGAVAYDDVPDALAAMDIGVVTARSAETFHYSPLKLQEYLAAGLAVVAPATAQLGSAYTDGDDLLLVPPGDVPSLAAALEALCEDDDLRTRLAGNGHRRQRESGGTAAQLERVLDALGDA
jgi:glycosyltransferase involved in cell wall biosynthesis